jgi:hypothetical protein
MKRPPVSLEYLIRALRGNARELAKPYERRDDDFEVDAAVWAIQEAARRLKSQDATIARLTKKLQEVKK